MAAADQATTLVALAQRQLDRVVSPSTRRETWSRTLDLAARRPGAFTFLALLTALTFPPIILFTTFVLSTFLLALGAAVLFTLFCTGAALFVLVPSLFFAAGAAVFLWTWAVASFLAVRWIARRTGTGWLDFGFGEGEDVGGRNGGQQREKKKKKGAVLDGGFEGYKREAEGEHDGVKSDM